MKAKLYPFPTKEDRGFKLAGGMKIIDALRFELQWQKRETK